MQAVTLGNMKGVMTYQFTSSNYRQERIGQDLLAQEFQKG